MYSVGDSFRLNITATNTSDRDLLIKKDWSEQLVFYHLLPGSSPTPSRQSSLAPNPQPLVPFQQVEWPGQVLVATWIDSSDVVLLKPNESYTVRRDVRVWTPDDVATFLFRLFTGV